MNKKLILVIFALLLLGIGAASFAYQTDIEKQTAMSCCCCGGDSCPMKNKDKASADAKSCCDNCDCCKGDNCPMKTKGRSTDSTAIPAGQAGSGDAKNCDCSCCHGQDAKTQS